MQTLLLLEYMRMGAFEAKFSSSFNYEFVQDDPILAVLGKSETPEKSFSFTIQFYEFGIKVNEYSYVYTGKKYTRVFFKISSVSTINFSVCLIDPYHYDILPAPPLKIDGPIVIGHRGSGADNVDIMENSMPSYIKATQNDADFIETDIHVSKDYIPIVNHNPYVRIKGKKSVIGKMTAEDFVNSGLSTKYNTKRSTFKEILMKIPKQVGLDIEIKIRDDFSVYERNFFNDCILDDMVGYAYDRSCYFCTFDPFSAIMMMLKQKRWYTTLLIHYPKSNDLRRMFKGYTKIFKHVGVWGFIIQGDDAINNLDAVAELKKEGFFLGIWNRHATIESSVSRLLEAGVQGFVTDDIPTTRELLKKL